MEQRTQKKKWKLPKLIVLVRNQPEEAVLAGCKNDHVNGPGTVYDTCIVAPHVMCSQYSSS